MAGTFKVANKIFDTGTHVMGIINLTPDSFYSQSRVGVDSVGDTAKRMLDDGAEVLDIGGQSTRPNATAIGALEEMGRVIDALCEIKKVAPNAIVSVDTFYPEVAEAAIYNGADMINDVSGLSYTPKTKKSRRSAIVSLQSSPMLEVLKRNDVSVCVMHNRRESTEPNLFLDKFLGIGQMVDALAFAGIKKDRVLLDLGIGFNHSSDEDWKLLKGYDKVMRDYGDYAFLLGASRKSMFGKEVSSRLSATLESTMLAVKMDVRFVRVHDVKENVAVIEGLK